MLRRIEFFCVLRFTFVCRLASACLLRLQNSPTKKEKGPGWVLGDLKPASVSIPYTDHTVSESHSEVGGRGVAASQHNRQHGAGRPPGGTEKARGDGGVLNRPERHLTTSRQPHTQPGPFSFSQWILEGQEVDGGLKLDVWTAVLVRSDHRTLIAKAKNSERDQGEEPSPMAQERTCGGGTGATSW